MFVMLNVEILQVAQKISVWRICDADCMSARDIHDPTTIAGNTTGQASLALALKLLMKSVNE